MAMKSLNPKTKLDILWFNDKINLLFIIHYKWLTDRVRVPSSVNFLIHTWLHHVDTSWGYKVTYEPN